jgi:hypothetical protein
LNDSQAEKTVKDIREFGVLLSVVCCNLSQQLTSKPTAQIIVGTPKLVEKFFANQLCIVISYARSRERGVREREREGGEKWEGKERERGREHS